MAVNIETLTGYLDEMEMRYALGRGEDLIIVPFDSINVRIILCENGEGIVFQAPQAYNLRSVGDLESCLVWMAQHTARHKIGHFGFDPRDGEVDVSFFFPVMDGTITLEQFRRMLLVCRDVALSDVDGLRRVAHGQPAEVDGEGCPGGECAECHGTSEEMDRFRDILGDLEAPPFPGDARRRRGAAETELEPEPLEPDSGPRDESEWLRAVVAAFRTLCSDWSNAPAVDRMRHELWPVFERVRAESAVTGLRYRSLETASEGRLPGEAEYLLLYLLARHTWSEHPPIAFELESAYAAADDPGGSNRFRETLDELERGGWIARLPGEGQPRYRLGSRYLEPLRDLLPFRWDPLRDRRDDAGGEFA